MLPSNIVFTIDLLIDLLPFSIKRIYFNEIKILLFCIIREKIEDQKIIKSLENIDSECDFPHKCFQIL